MYQKKTNDKICYIIAGPNGAGKTTFAEEFLPGESFAFETTLSGRLYIKKISNMKTKGYKVIVYFLKLASVDLAIERVKLRVSEGGHNVPIGDIERRFERSWANFQGVYRDLVDEWIIFDTSGHKPRIIEQSR